MDDETGNRALGLHSSIQLVDRTALILVFNPATTTTRFPDPLSHMLPALQQPPRACHLDLLLHAVRRGVMPSASFIAQCQAILENTAAPALQTLVHPTHLFGGATLPNFVHWEVYSIQVPHNIGGDRPPPDLYTLSRLGFPPSATPFLSMPITTLKLGHDLRWPASRTVVPDVLADPPMLQPRAVCLLSLHTLRSNGFPVPGIGFPVLYNLVFPTRAAVRLRYVIGSIEPITTVIRPLLVQLPSVGPRAHVVCCRTSHGARDPKEQSAPWDITIRFTADAPLSSFNPSALIGDLELSAFLRAHASALMKMLTLFLLSRPAFAGRIHTLHIDPRRLRLQCRRTSSPHAFPRRPDTVSPGDRVPETFFVDMREIALEGDKTRRWKRRKIQKLRVAKGAVEKDMLEILQAIVEVAVNARS
ncbi:hypothetical protein K488DRAFT_81617 [Vararia minispora EC-137]|uniref:Uncharacterized protein n=1 Tax=Vararia minispora EC-137 TaxID=1314806 RepID=A0ACB8QYS1_9AGAM|nr:hypothetical protein K488DRAFT_81617 [Vararia minispora EC-137]